MSKEQKVWIRLNRACNNRCVFCLDAPSHDGTIFNKKHVENSISDGMKSLSQSGKKRLILSGGEPTLHQDLIHFIAYGKKLGFDRVQVISNGRMFYYPKFLQQCIEAGLDEITFSIHGNTSDLHDALSGMQGSFDQAIAGLKNALQAGIIVNVDIVISKYNYKELLDIIKFFHALGVSEFDLLTIMPYGRAWENFDSLYYEMAEFKPIFQNVLEYGAQHNMVIWCNRFPIYFFEGFEHMIGDVEQKLHSEIFGERIKKFEDFVQKGTIMNCFDINRCAHCYLGDFCAKLIYARALLQKNCTDMNILTSPQCIAPNAESVISLESLGSPIYLNLFFDFYIKNLLCYKSSRCTECAHMYSCPGLHLDLIRKNGLKTLTPIKHG